MKKFLRNNGLSLVLCGFFVVFWIGQTAVGRVEYNDERREHGKAAVGVGEYLATGHFWEATAENWESEFLQMSAYVFLTAWLYQKGSSESNDPDGAIPQDADPREEAANPESPWPVRRGGWWLRVYEHSLGLAFALLFLGAAVLHALGGMCMYNEELAAKGEVQLSLLGYVMSSRFWFESLQNWQSEFLAIASMVILSIFLRQRGSPESKAVASPNWATGE